jgi:hypothetical protein
MFEKYIQNKVVLQIAKIIYDSAKFSDICLFNVNKGRFYETVCRFVLYSYFDFKFAMR